MAESVFTKIIKGEIPAHKLYEDDKTLAFLDIRPVAPGHTLVITKIQVDQYIDLPDEDYIALWQTVKKVAKHLKQQMGTDRVRVGIVGTDVPHVHVHLIPFNEGNKISEDDANQAESSDQDLAELAKKLAL